MSRSGQWRTMRAPQLTVRGRRAGTPTRPACAANHPHQAACTQPPAPSPQTPPPPQFLSQLLKPEHNNTLVAAARRASPELKALADAHPGRLTVTHVDVADEASVQAWAKGLADAVRQAGLGQEGAAPRGRGRGGAVGCGLGAWRAAPRQFACPLALSPGHQG